VSIDNGETWRPSMRSMPPRLITYSILQDSRDANLIYLGTNLGVYRSLDRGASWAPAAMPIKPATPAKGKAGKKATAAATAPQAAAKPPSETVRKVQQALNAAGYSVGVPDGRAGKQTIAALRKYQADRHLPVSGKIDDITLKSLGMPAGSGDETVALADAVNALVQTIDVETKQPLLLAATNAGLYRSLDPVMGWQKIPYGASHDPRTSCISADPQQPESILVGTAASGV